MRKKNKLELPAFFVTSIGLMSAIMGGILILVDWEGVNSADKDDVFLIIIGLVITVIGMSFYMFSLVKQDIPRVKKYIFDTITKLRQGFMSVIL